VSSSSGLETHAKAAFQLNRLSQTRDNMDFPCHALWSPSGNKIVAVLDGCVLLFSIEWANPDGSSTTMAEASYLHSSREEESDKSGVLEQACSIPVKIELQKKVFTFASSLSLFDADQWALVGTYDGSFLKVSWDAQKPMQKVLSLSRNAEHALLRVWHPTTTYALQFHDAKDGNDDKNYDESKEDSAEGDEEKEFVTNIGAEKVRIASTRWIENLRALVAITSSGSIVISTLASNNAHIGTSSLIQPVVLVSYPSSSPSLKPTPSVFEMSDGPSSYRSPLATTITTSGNGNSSSNGSNSSSDGKSGYSSNGTSSSGNDEHEEISKLLTMEVVDFPESTTQTHSAMLVCLISTKHMPTADASNDSNGSTHGDMRQESVSILVLNVSTLLKLFSLSPFASPRSDVGQEEVVEVERGGSKPSSPFTTPRKKQQHLQQHQQQQRIEVSCSQMCRVAVMFQHFLTHEHRFGSGRSSPLDSRSSTMQGCQLELLYAASANHLLLVLLGGVVTCRLLGRLNSVLFSVDVLGQDSIPSIVKTRSQEEDDDTPEPEPPHKLSVITLSVTRGYLLISSSEVTHLQQVVSPPQLELGVDSSSTSLKWPVATEASRPPERYPVLGGANVAADAPDSERNSKIYALWIMLSTELDTNSSGELLYDFSRNNVLLTRDELRQISLEPSFASENEPLVASTAIDGSGQEPKASGAQAQAQARAGQFVSHLKTSAKNSECLYTSSSLKYDVYYERVLLPRTLQSDVLYYLSSVTQQSAWSRKRCGYYRNWQGGLLLSSSARMPVSYIDGAYDRQSPAETDLSDGSAVSTAARPCMKLHHFDSNCAEYLVAIAGGLSAPYTTHTGHKVLTKHQQQQQQQHAYPSQSHPSNPSSSSSSEHPLPQLPLRSPVLWVYNAKTRRWRSTCLQSVRSVSTYSSQSGGVDFFPVFGGIPQASIPA
jgi:hypothetical protein